MTLPIARVLADLAQALQNAGFRWYLFGAQAAILHGAARLTADVDVSVDPGGRPTRELADALTSSGFELRFADTAFVEQTRVLPCVHRASRTPVDIVLTGPGPEELFHARAVLRDVGGTLVPVASAEDIVVMKVLAGRGKDLEDVRAILAMQRDQFDLALARETLRQLETALDRSDLSPELEQLVTQSASKR